VEWGDFRGGKKRKEKKWVTPDILADSKVRRRKALMGREDRIWERIEGGEGQKWGVLEVCPERRKNSFQTQKELKEEMEKRCRRQRRGVK